jgi:opacity protein-like surface antigen
MRKLLIASVAIATLTAGAAYADVMTGSNTYASVLGGPSFDPALSVSGTRRNMDTGFNAGARAGISLDNVLPWSGFSTEADFFYNRSPYSLTTGHINSASYMGNLIYHFDAGMPVKLYGGAGLGAVNTGLGGSLHGSSTVFGWQAIGGVEYPLAQNTSLFTEYRYQNAHDANIGAVKGVGNTSNSLSVGVKFNM